MTAPSIVYFGDSLTDNGNLYAYGEGILPDATRDTLAGPTGAVSDGPTHASYTAEILGAAEVNYAVASAEAVGTQTLQEVVTNSGLEDQLLVPVDDPALQLDINLSAQIDRFAADSAGEDLSNSAGYILIGGNDFNNLDLDSPTLIQEALALVDQIIAAQVDAALALFAQGMSTVFLAELPVAEFFAESTEFTPFQLFAAEFAFDTFNAGLAEAVLDLQADGFDARLGETSIVTAAIAEDPTGFGLLAPYGQTLADGSPFDPDQVAFYDDIHPTTATHGIFGAFNAHELVGGTTILGNEGEADAGFASTQPGEPVVAFALDADDTYVFTGGGGAIAFGGTGDDLLVGANGTDLLSGGEGDDALNGRMGDDVMNGGLGNDTVKGMIGDDVLVDSLGDDFLRGGLGDDTFIFTEAGLLGGTDNGLNIVIGGQGLDTLYLVLEEDAIVSDALLDSLGIRTVSVEQVVVLEGRDALGDVFTGDDWYGDADLWGLV